MLHGHDGTCDELRLILEACGSTAQREQHIPAWDRPVLDSAGAAVYEDRRDALGHLVCDTAGHVIRDQVWDRAIMDLCFTDRGGRRAHADVTIGAARTVQAEEQQLRNQTDGRKASLLAARKRLRYDPSSNPHEGFTPFAIESHGRLGDDALALLRGMAPTERRDRSRVLARALQGLSVRVQTRLAEQLLSAERSAGAH